MALAIKHAFSKHNEFARTPCTSARSVAASYKPPILVTRVRLPACALYSGKPMQMRARGVAKSQSRRRTQPGSSPPDGRGERGRRSRWLLAHGLNNVFPTGTPVNRHRVRRRGATPFRGRQGSRAFPVGHHVARDAALREGPFRDGADRGRRRCAVSLFTSRVGGWP